MASKATSTSKSAPQELNYAEILEQLKSNDKETTFVAIQNLFAALSSPRKAQLLEYIAQILKHIPVELLFNAFKFATAEEKDEFASTTYFVISKLLENTPTLLIKQESFARYMLIGSKHPNPLVKMLVLQQLARISETTEDLEFLTKLYMDIIINAFSDADLAVLKEATNIVSNIAKTSAEFFLASKILERLRNTLSSTGILKMRLFELYVTLANVSDTILQYLVQHGFINDLIAELDTSDPLDLLNALEIIKTLSSSKSGFQYLEKTECFSKIVNLYLKYQQDPLLSSLLLHFISDFAARGDSTLNLLQPNVIFKILFESLKTGSTKEQETSLVVIGNLVARTKAALNFFLLDPKSIKIFFEYWDSPELPISNAVAHMIAEILESTIHSSTDLVPIFEYLQANAHQEGKTLVEKLMYMAKQPFPEERYALFHLIRALCKHTYGVKALCDYPLFVDFVIDRSTESTKEGKEWKYAIALNLFRTLYPTKAADTENKPTVNAIDQMQKHKLKQFLSKGPFYVEAEAAVAIETQAR